jgi:hypothetical protein
MSASAPVLELYPGVSEHGFASMMAELLRTNLQDRPHKVRDFAAMKGRVALVAEDAETAVTLVFMGGKLRVHPEVYGVPDLVIRGSSEALIDLSRIPPLERLPALPDPRSDIVRSLGRALRERRLTVTGGLRRPGLLLRLGRVLSIY